MTTATKAQPARGPAVPANETFADWQQRQGGKALEVAGWLYYPSGSRARPSGGTREEPADDYARARRRRKYYEALVKRGEATAARLRATGGWDEWFGPKPPRNATRFLRRAIEDAVRQAEDHGDEAHRLSQQAR